MAFHPTNSLEHTLISSCGGTHRIYVTQISFLRCLNISDEILRIAEYSLLILNSRPHLDFVLLRLLRIDIPVAVIPDIRRLHVNHYGIFVLSKFHFFLTHMNRLWGVCVDWGS